MYSKGASVITDINNLVDSMTNADGIACIVRLRSVGAISEEEYTNKLEELLKRTEDKIEELMGIQEEA